VRYLLGLIIGLAGLWLLLSGHYSPMLLGLGALSCLFTAFVCLRMRLVDAETIPLHMATRLPGYLFWLAIEIAKSNWDVAKRIVMPGRNISPTMVTLRARQSSELGQVIFANSITLTPGTVTVGLRDGVAEVHALTEDNARDMEGGEMDQRVRTLEGQSTNAPGRGK